MLNVQEKQFHKWDTMCFLGKNLFAIMAYYFGQFVKWRVPVKNLAAYTYLWQIQESHLLTHLKRTGFYYTMYLRI